MRVVTIEAADVRQSRFLEEHGRELAKKNTKARSRVPWRYHAGRVEVMNGVTLEEAVEAARKLYPDLTLKATSARMWTARGLLPNPEKVERLGGRLGNRAHYSDDLPAQIAAAAFTTSRGYTQKQVAQARRVVLEGVPVADDLMSDVVRILTNNISPDFIPSKGALELAGAIQRYSLALAMARGGRVVSKPWGHLVGIAHGTDTAGRPTFAYYASIPGLYWDPRIEGKQPDIALDLDQQIRAQRAALRDRNGAS
jgi:hypothetical protein